MFAVGADIGGTSVKIGVFEDSGKIMAKSRIPTRKDDNCRHVLEDTAAEIKRLLRANHIEPGEVLGIGAGVPGPVADGVVTHCVNLHWTDKVDAAARLEEMTGIRTSLINDANAAALGEQWMGAGKGRKSMVFVTIGTGVGGGIIIGGNVLTGAGGAAGEIGHITVENGGRACNCGRKGCLETYASATGIVATAREKLESFDGYSKLRQGEISAEAVFNAAKEGDAVALSVVDDFAARLGKALANISVVVDPEIIVLGGGVSKAGEIVRKNVEKYYAESAFMSVRDRKIVIAVLGEDAGIYGAARQAVKTAGALDGRM